VTSRWHVLRGSQFASATVGALAVCLLAYVTAQSGGSLTMVAAAGVLVYVLAVVGFLLVPHLAVAGTIALFAFVPALKVFTTPSIGGIKDVICLSAITAGAILIAFERRRPDWRVGLLVTLLMLLYVVNVGHGHGTNWVQGMRLTGEPMLLLIVGSVLSNPRRTLRYALGSLVAVGVIVALYGLLQQVLGQYTLVSLGYHFNQQVRTISGLLRSFGTFDDPFAYAAFLYFAIAAVIFWLPRGFLSWAAGTVLLLGLTASFVRTGVLIVIAFFALALIRRGFILPAVCFVGATVILAVSSLSGASGTQVQSVPVYFSNGGQTTVHSPVSRSGSLVLNGRVSAWQAAVGSNPFDWVFGRGVGEVGTAAARASTGFIPGTSAASTNSASKPSQKAVDSAYFATLADVGVIGLAVLLVLLARLFILCRARIKLGQDAGWVGLALLVSMLLDSLTRASFTGFPTAFVALLVLGLTVSQIDETPSTSSGPVGPEPRRRAERPALGSLRALQR
jgi:hypothetical protein